MFLLSNLKWHALPLNGRLSFVEVNRLDSEVTQWEERFCWWFCVWMMDGWGKGFIALIHTSSPQSGKYKGDLLLFSFTHKGHFICFYELFLFIHTSYARYFLHIVDLPPLFPLVTTRADSWSHTALLWASGPDCYTCSAAVFSAVLSPGCPAQCTGCHNHHIYSGLL